MTCFVLTGSLFNPEHSEANSGEVNVYSYRQPFLVKPLFDKFTDQTGIKVNVIFAQKGLLEKIKLEGQRSPADVLLTVDITRLLEASQTIAQEVNSDTLIQYIPPAFRGQQNRWFALTHRARVAFVSNRLPEVTQLTYAELADPKWQGKICTRSGQHPYNLAMFAAYLTKHGEAATQEWLGSLKKNLARKPSGNDRAQVRAVYAGECDIAIGNTYYMGAMVENDKNPEQKEWAQSVHMVFPDNHTTGTHVNLSGMVMARYAPNKKNAQKLMEFLVSQAAQKIYANLNYEYPVRADTLPSPLVQSWGALKPDTTHAADIAANRSKASRMVDIVGYDR
ncbi:MAG TPA: iron ABC transporter substrate-binding protein [Rhodobiaceae bacterium]|nr:iron ABC transporter substrate-binding protein [Rhodobiaceae bacterium]